MKAPHQRVTFVSVQDDALAIFLDGDTECPDFLISTIEEWDAFWADADPGELSFRVSSSVDFPEQYTENKDVIELCHRMQGA